MMRLRHILDHLLVLGYRSRRRELLRERVFDLAGHFTPTIAVDGQAGRFLVSTRDKMIGRTLFVRGHYEDLDTLRQVVAFLKHRSGGGFQLEGRTFIDIGANIGTAAIAAVNVLNAGNAYAFEPGPENFKLLRQNIIANGLEHRIHAIQAAASSEAGSLSLALSNENWGDNRISSGVAAGNFGATVEVEAVTLDSAILSEKIDLDEVAMIWIDAQGHEPDVLTGAVSVLRRDIPVVAEYWPDGYKSEGLKQFELLVQDHFTSWADVKESTAAGQLVEHSTSEIGRLRETYTNNSFTDLLLMN